MKNILLALALLIPTVISFGQTYSSAVEIVTVFSENERFYLKSVPFDNETPSLRGRTSVFEIGNPVPLYSLERGFDSGFGRDNTLLLSNDGEVVFYALTSDQDEEKDGLRSINIYRRGQLVKSFTKSQVTGCDEAKENCDLIYSNYDEVIDREKSNLGTGKYKAVFKEGVDDKERFLFDCAIFGAGDLVYLTDSKKQLHIFDLRKAERVDSQSFEKLFPTIQLKARLVKSELERHEVQFTELKLPNGRKADGSLAKFLDMKVVDTTSTKDNYYKSYTFKIDGELLRDGSFTVENLECFDQELPKERILAFFNSTKFDTTFLPTKFEKWHIREEYFSFRNKNDRIARIEKKEEQKQNEAEYQQRLTLESINGLYIPANLSECFIALDKLLKEVDLKEIRALPKREDMSRHHMGLGLWMRNNWGLWAGSRLQKYFLDHGVRHPDDMSGVILSHYHDWLHEQRDTWIDWEKKNRRIQ